MKKRLILPVFAIVAANLFVGCYGGIALDVDYYYNNSITVINTATTDNDGRLDILVNGAYYATIYNSSKSELAEHDATTIKRSGFSNVPINWNYEIQAIGKKNGKTVAAYFPFYATSYAYGGGNHQTWIITDEQLQPYRP